MNAKEYVCNYLESDMFGLKSRLANFREGGLHTADPAFGKLLADLETAANALDKHVKACLESKPKV